MKPDAVYYFAGQSSIYKSLKNPKSTLDSNFHGAKIFLNVIHKNRLNTKFFKANSGYIFKTLKFKKNLKYQFLKPNNPYIDAQVKAFKVVEKFKLKQFSELDSPAKPRWPLDADAAFLKGAGVKF